MRLTAEAGESAEFAVGRADRRVRRGFRARAEAAQISFEDFGSVLGDGVDGWGVGCLPRRADDVEDAARRRHRRQAFKQVFGVVEPALDSSPELQDPEELLDGPALEVSADQGVSGGGSARPRLGASQALASSSKAAVTVELKFPKSSEAAFPKCPSSSGFRELRL